MSKPNKDGWIRHRGGKCPVDKGVMVYYRMRQDVKSGFFSIASDGAKLRWTHEGLPGDIMAYRLHNPAIEPAAVDNVEPVADGPLQWRDRIQHLDNNILNMQTERADLIKRLADEGLQLLEGKVCGGAKPSEDMSDWRNWRIGDIAEVIDTSGFLGKLRIGDIVPITHVDADGTIKAAPHCWGIPGESYKFHSRP